MTRKPAAVRVVAEGSHAAAASRFLWAGLVRYNRQTAGQLRYTRKVLTVRDAKNRIQGGVILQSYWKETYVELLWLSPNARRSGLGRLLMQEAERRARKRGSVLMHLNTYSFQAPGFYEKLGFRRFGGMEGSPAGASRHFYAKRPTRS